MVAEYVEVWRVSGCELVALERERLTIGRDEANDVVLDDQTVSRVHAVFEQYGTAWVVRDVGSANGTFVNGDRVAADRALRPGDEMAVGSTRLVFRGAGSQAGDRATLGVEGPPEVTRRERDVLIELCRPLRSGDSFAVPATVKELAETLKLWHKYLSYAMGVLVLMHTGAALKHHFVDRDGTLGRMWLRGRTA